MYIRFFEPNIQKITKLITDFSTSENMTSLDWNGSLRCECGLHTYAPDMEAGYPYQRCERCDKLGIYHPSPPAGFRLGALLR